jgi:hypothetical protein
MQHAPRLDWMLAARSDDVGGLDWMLAARSDDVHLHAGKLLMPITSMAPSLADDLVTLMHVQGYMSSPIYIQVR